VIIRAYTFIPKKMDRSKKQPLLVLAHQGLHGNVSSVELAHVIREMMEQGYAVIAPDYRGSTGYGQGFYNLVDYGGREVDDVLAGKVWMLEKYSFLDPKRVGAIGWSHGGLITLMQILAHPDSGYAVAYAGVPVSDLVLRMGYEVAHHLRREAGNPSSNSHQHQRRGRQRAGGEAHDHGVEGRGQAVRIEGLRRRPRRAHVQPAGYETGARLAGGNLRLLSQVFEALTSNCGRMADLLTYDCKRW
jgi:acetyl esterase/lipase